MFAMMCTRPDLAYADSKSVHVKSRKATLGSSEVGATISARDYKIRLDISEVENRKA